VNLTRLAIRRPTLAFVFVATMLLAGFIAMRQLVVQSQPDAGLPTIDIRIEYAGSPPTFIRDNIVRPLEDQIAGSPGLAHQNSLVELGAADILVQFQLGTSIDSDLAYVEQSLQAAKSQLPIDLITPVTRVVDPAQGVVATIAVHSRKMPVTQLAQFANVQIMPNIEQLGGISDAHVVNLPQAAFEVTVDPAMLVASNLTLTDFIDTISANNVRAAGGLIYGKYETEIDVRGDLPDVASIENLPIKLSPPSFALPGGQGVPASSGVAYAGGGAAAAGGGGGSGGGGGGGSGATGGGSGAMGGGSGAMGGGSGAMGGSGSSTGGGAGAMGGGGSGGAAMAGGGSASTVTSTSGTAAMTSGNGSANTVGTGSGPVPTTNGPSPGPGSVGSSGASSMGGSSPGGSPGGGTASGGASSGGGSAGISLGGSGGSGSAGGAGAAVSTPGAQVSTTVGGAPATSGQSVPVAPMPQIPQVLGGGAALAVAPGVGMLSPYSLVSPNRKIGDFAGVALTSKPVRTYEVLDGSPGVEMQMLKFASASEISVAQSIERHLPEIQKKFPDEQLRIDHVQATYSQAQVDGVIRTVLEAVALVAIVMLFFLKSWRNAVVVLVAIPTSLAVTLLAMRLLGLTLDVVSLLAMSLVIGTLVDDSTVVLENVERHHRDGEEPVDAALRGRSEIGTAAVVITLVDVVVFLPIAFLGGVVGKQLSEFGIVVSVATLTSLFVSFVVTPTLAGRWSLASEWKPWGIIEAFDRGFERVRGWYAGRVLPAAGRRPWPWLVVTLVLVAGALALLPLGIVGREYIPAGDRPDVYVQITYPSGTSLDQTQTFTQPLDKKLNGLADAESVETSYGSFDTQQNITADEGSAAQLHVYLKPSAKTPEVVRQIRDLAKRILPSGAQAVVFPADSQTGAPARSIEQIVSHADETDPADDGTKVARALRATAGAVDVVDTSKNIAPEVQVVFDRDAARVLDVPIGTASTAIRAAFGGATASQITTPNGLVQIDVIYPRSRQLSLAEIGRVPIRTGDGRIVHVEDVAHIKYEASAAILTREDRADVVRVSASLAPGYELSNVLTDFNHRVDDLHLGDNVTVAASAESSASLMNEALSTLGPSLIGSVVLVYLLMVALYNSYRSPLVVLFAIPPATIGAFAALALTHQTLNLYSLIGMILLVGLVTKNSILLVDYANTLRAERGLDRDEAMAESAKTRFRPIVMTTIAIIAGLTPVALGLDPGAASRRALGIVVIGGLFSSLVLTLVLVPLFYRWIAPKRLDRGVRFEDERERAPSGPAPAPAPAS